MHVALTGASGFLGSVIARTLNESGHRVTALVRTKSRRDHIEAFVDRFVVGDQDDETAWPALLEGAECLVHNAFDFSCLKRGDLKTHYRSNVLAAMKLIDSAVPRPVVFMSSIAVHHDMRPRWQGVIDEDHPMRPGNLYGSAKAAVETHLWAHHATNDLRFCALRPCAVYGIDPRLARSIGAPMVRSIQAGEAYTRTGGGKFVHVDDVATATVNAATDPNVSGVFNLADVYARWADLAAMIAEIVGVTVPIDTSSPETPRNTFTKDAARSLGVTLDRGHEGLHRYLETLAPLVSAEQATT